ncbi:DUF1674 domain-containing protein [Phaeovulum sp.]|uniref:DUF1674 domain-containing protein n=1 Tax=Phaeovulum sp. TaxID=2934796 RepID=UPI003522A7C0
MPCSCPAPLASCTPSRALYHGAAPHKEPAMRDEKTPNLPAAARRALAEAAARRKAAATVALPTELGGRDGPEPVRYGDWEKKGLAIDF